MSALTTLLIYLAAGTALAYRKSSLRTAAIAFGALALFYLAFGGPRNVLVLWLLIVTAALCALLSLESLRRGAITRPLFKLYRKALPPLSDTEREAIDAGTVWWDGELFTGEPDWRKLLATGKPQLSAEERAFLDGPVEELCRMTDAWKLHVQAEIPEPVMRFIKERKFLGMIIPKEYGGLDLSAVAQSEVLTKVLSAGSVVGNFIMVPNSLGPGELLMKYGTEEQKNHYLPRLATGEEIPCFALTGPLAGSDATSIPDAGIVCNGMWEGKEIVGMRLSFEKRYITLAPVATLVGLAFRLQDPQHLIGTTDDYGITCALIPRSTPGLDIGRRHLPVGDPFYNGPVRGKDVFVPLDFIIGGKEMAGKGWRMLVNCLSAGRAISLPSASNSLAKRSAAGAGAYARIRRQFKIPIGQFEGIQKPLARIAGFAWIIDAGRLNTAQAVAAGSKPSVPSAILKYHCTEMARQAINDAFDIHGGKAVMRGPKNYLAPGYESIPVAITVEGANIMTRSLMIFGQGAIRSHPYVLKEMELAQREDAGAALYEFDRTLFAHAGYTCTNAARAFVHGLTRSAFAPAPASGNVRLRRWYREVNRLSAAFALVADAAMLTMQGSLKRREMISGRLGDLLSMIYLASMVLKRHEDEQCPDEDLPLVEWSCRWLLHRYQQSMHELLENLPNRPVAFVLRLLVFPTGRHYEMPSDRLDSTVAALITRNTAARRRLIAGIDLAPGDNNPLGRLNALLADADAMEPLERKLREAVKADRIPALLGRALIDAGEKAGVLDAGEAARMRDYDARVMDVIHVDDFAASEIARDPFPA